MTTLSCGHRTLLNDGEGMLAFWKHWECTEDGFKEAECYGSLCWRCFVEYNAESESQRLLREDRYEEYLRDNFEDTE